MEPERKIEKWLKSYAKKRRSQAVGFKLDPAARQRLQNEVSRNAPSGKDDDETMSLWQLIRQQWAFLVGFAVCIFLVAMVFFWSGGKKQPMEFSSAKNIAPAPASMPAVPAPQDEATPVMAPPPAPVNQTFAASREMAPVLPNAFMNTLALNSSAVPVLVNFHVEQNGDAIRVVDQDGSVYVGILRMASPMTRGTLGEDQNATESQAGPVLADTVTQNVEGVGGDRPAPAAPFGSTPGSMSASTLGGTSDGASGSTLQSAQNNSSPSPPNYTFRVIGFNQTLKQNIQFTATVLGDTSAAKAAQTVPSLKTHAALGAVLTQSMMQYQPGPLPWSNLTITGTVIINRTNQIQVNATPVPPAK